MSERGARAQIAAAMSLLVVLAAFSEGWVDSVISRIRSLTAGGGDVPGTQASRGESGFGPGAGAGQGAGGGGGGSF